MKHTVSLLLLLLVFICDGSRVVHRCFLARKLRQAGFDRFNILQFLCIAKMVSNFNMTLSVKRERGQRTVGIFQLASSYSCYERYVPGMRNGRCHKLCSAFLDENLEDDIACASGIRYKWGFKHWTGWERTCLYAKVSPLLDGCDYKN
ncbi:lysozyme C-like [Ornithodoros turicata]|uniref:lysozyme C-like n=1 Tax=Ornithodoros turicata TaxID=34597 RepID=UPI0031389549